MGDLRSTREIKLERVVDWEEYRIARIGEKAYESLVALNRKLEELNETFDRLARLEQSVIRREQFTRIK